jgi:acyl carrier protein
MKNIEILKIIKKYTLEIYKNKKIEKKTLQEIGIDSLKTVEMIAEIENTFKIHLTDKELNKKTFQSVNNLIKVILKKL